MELYQNSYAIIENDQTPTQQMKYTNDCGYFMGDGVVCKRCGVDFASHS